MAVDNNLKELRESLDYSRKGLAYAIGVSEKTIRNIETNGSCTLEIALKLSGYLSLSVESIFTLGNDEIAPLASPKHHSSGRKSNKERTAL